jgi:signal transduction histidine kinase
LRYTEPCFGFTMRDLTPSQEILYGLIHDLRQPLGNMEMSLFYLDRVLDRPSDRVREQMRIMERQVAQASQLLLRAAEEISVLRNQRGADNGADAAENLDFTKPATAAVT